MNKFKNPQGAHYLKPIFFEWDSPEKQIAIYTLKDYDHKVDGKTYVSLRRAYVAEEDPTEHRFAEKYLDGWSHWKKLLECGWFQDHVREWREELLVKLQSRALATMIDKSKSKDSDSLQAMKFILTQGWVEKDKKTTGPRTKDKIKQEAQEILRTNSDVQDDYARIMNDKRLN